ncbi:hypothetical protein [Pseudonocardia pini]|nr:hypothetical protein [Pseudonocardia pini]
MNALATPMCPTTRSTMSADRLAAHDAGLRRPVGGGMTMVR